MSDSPERSVLDLYPEGATTFGNALKELRLHKDPPWSKKKLADEAGVSKSLISRLEADESIPLDTTLERLARALRVPRVDLEKYIPTREKAAS